MTRLTRAWRRLRRAVLARRRLLAALLTAVAVLAVLRAHAAPPPPQTLVLTAAHDLSSGVVVGPDDLARIPFDPASVPAGMLPRAVALGRTTAGPVRAGEPLTDARLLTSSLLSRYPGLVAVPVRVGDAGTARLLRVGDRVDVLAADPQGQDPAAVVGRDVPVLALPAPDRGSRGLTEGALVVLGVPDATARSLAQASVSRFLSVVLFANVRCVRTDTLAGSGRQPVARGDVMLKGFKDFIMRGNLVELAVAFIIGGAFATVVTSFTAVILALIAKVIGGKNPNMDDFNPGDVPVGAFLTAAIAFLILAFVVYFFVVTPYNALQARMSRGEEAAPPSPDIALLTEIRDLLAGRPGGTSVEGGGGLT